MKGKDLARRYLERVAGMREVSKHDENIFRAIITRLGFTARVDKGLVWATGEDIEPCTIQDFAKTLIEMGDEKEGKKS